MYEASWEFAEPPVDNSPNPKFSSRSPEHDEALVRLVDTARRRKGCRMLTGEYGYGKTTLTRALVQRLETERCEIGLLTNPSGNAVAFLREVLDQLGVDTEARSKRELDYTNTVRYISHRLRTAGQPNQLFTEEAITGEIGEKVLAEVIKDMVGVS